jgi:hypothetical protein
MKDFKRSVCPPTINYTTPDPACELRPNSGGSGDIDDSLQTGIPEPGSATIAITALVTAWFTRRRIARRQ